MANISKLELLTEFGFTRDPFKNFNMQSNDNTRIGKVVGMAVKDRVMVSVIGERGIGKSRSIRAALGKIKDIGLVYSFSNDINKLLISDIEQAFIFDLSNEKPKRGREIRARQLRRILGEASTRKDIVLVIEEAHHLHGMTLRALKRLREMEWMGETELFSIILVCQSDPLNKPGVSEVRLRSDSIHLKGLSQNEIKEFIRRSVGNIFDQKAIEVIPTLPHSHNYEDLKAILFQLMNKALFAGRKQVITDDIESIFSASELTELPGMPRSTDSKLLKSEDDENLSSVTKKKKAALGGFLKHHQDDNTVNQRQAAIG